MTIGKTATSISVSELFERYSEVDILTTVFPEITSIPCKISSPFRVDNNPSFSIYLDDNKHIKFKDFGDSASHGGLLDLLCKYWKCTFRQVFDKIINLMQSQKTNYTSSVVRTRQIKVLTHKESSELLKIQVAVRPWRDYDIEYWESYGITKKWLVYAGVYPISHKIVTKKDKLTGKLSKYIFPADKLAYCYTEYKDNQLQIKIYQPKNIDGFKWCSKMDASVISLWTKVPERGDRVVICSSLKDALVLSCQLHIPAIAPQGEGYNISDTAASELRRRFKKVFICFDTDTPGKKDAEKLTEHTGFINVVPDLGTEKDLSDYFKSLTNKEDFKQLETLFQ